MKKILVALLFVTTTLAGCASSSEPAPEPAPQLAGPGLENLVNNTLVFEAVNLPFSETFALPEGATMVRFVADHLSNPTVSVGMHNTDTGRRRCNQQPVVGFGQTFLGERSCSSITALDQPGDEWTVDIFGSGTADARIEFLTTPVDGIAGMLNLTLLSKATHELQPTDYTSIISHDGIELWTEVTLPEGEGPWPTVIASSPYNGQAGRGTNPAMWTYWTQDWAKRGYAAVNVDVRGFGMSGGCVEVWGEKEQLDQVEIVEWVAKQPWSDGNVGFYGQSYVGTTPVAAAVNAPEALKAIIAVAPVINAYEDWHYGGVPNGESSLSPVAYQVLVDTPGVPDPTQQTDLAAIIANAAKGVCDPTLTPLANSPTATTNEFYDIRNFKLRAHEVEAAVLFTEGFEDANVKSAMIPGWFNELNSPKLGVFGHWLHQHPARMDQETLFLGWMDHYVKGRDLGFDNIPSVVTHAETEWHRMTDTWPSEEAVDLEYGLEFNTGTMSQDARGGSYDLAMLPVDPDAPLGGAVTLTTVLDEDTPWIAGSLDIGGTFAGENGFIYARVDETKADGSTRMITYGMLNLALRNGYDSYEPAAGQISGTIPFRPTEHILEAGSTITLTIRGVQAGEAVGTAQPQPAVFQLQGSASALIIPTVPMENYEPTPISALP